MKELNVIVFLLVSILSFQSSSIFKAKLLKFFSINKVIPFLTFLFFELSKVLRSFLKFFDQR